MNQGNQVSSFDRRNQGSEVSCRCVFTILTDKWPKLTPTKNIVAKMRDDIIKDGEIIKVIEDLAKCHLHKIYFRLGQRLLVFFGGEFGSFCWVSINYSV